MAERTKCTCNTRQAMIMQSIIASLPNERGGVRMPAPMHFKKGNSGHGSISLTVIEAEAVRDAATALQGIVANVR